MKTPNTQKNEKRLQRVLKIVVSATDLTPEFKLAFKAYINETISDIRERGIATYHDLIDYLREKAEQRIQKILYSALTISKILELLHLLQPASQ